MKLLRRIIRNRAQKMLVPPRGKALIIRVLNSEWRGVVIRLVMDIYRLGISQKEDGRRGSRIRSEIQFGISEREEEGSKTENREVIIFRGWEFGF